MFSCVAALSVLLLCVVPQKQGGECSVSPVECLPAFALYVNAVVCVPENSPQPELEATTSAINKRDGQRIVAQTYTAIHAQTHGEYTFREMMSYIFILR